MKAKLLTALIFDNLILIHTIHDYGQGLCGIINKTPLLTRALGLFSFIVWMIKKVIDVGGGGALLYPFQWSPSIQPNQFFNIQGQDL